jgi:molecular chaperone GrpE
VLDDIDRARQHGEVSGGFKVVADTLEATVAKLGLTRFGAEGDAFDPTVHEAVMHSESPDVDGPTCVSVMRSGWTIGDRLVRPAMVAVAEPGGPAPQESDLSEEAVAVESDGAAS